MSRRIYFSFASDIAEIDSAFTKLIAELLRDERNLLINHENTMIYNHGRRWVSVSSSNSDEESEIEAHQTETSINLQDIRDHQVMLIQSFITNIVRKMTESFQRSLYQTISTACENSGNIINAKQYESTADAMLATLKKIEFGVDKNGDVSIPEFHAGSETIEKLKIDAEKKGPEFQKQIDDVVAVKTKTALEREYARKSRYKVQK